MLAAALSIHSVEGRHAAALNTLLGESITPDGAFAEPAGARRSPQVRRTLHRRLTPASEEKGERDERPRYWHSPSSPVSHIDARQRRPLPQRGDPQGSAGRRRRLRRDVGRPRSSAGRWRCPKAATSASSTSPSRSSTSSRPSTRKRRSRAKASGELKSLIDLVGRDEDEHVGALTETIKKLGGKPVAEPKFDFPYSGTAGFLKLAQTFEDTGVSAYNGAAPQIKSKEVLGAAGSIVQVEARHAAAIRLQNGEEPAPDAFDPALSEAKVLKAVEPFIQ